MLIYLTSDKNKGVFNFLTENNGIPIRSFIGEFTLLDFVANDLSNFDSCRYLAVDLECLLDVPEGLYEAAESIQKWFDRRLIIFARELNPELEKGLLERAVYNIITGDPDEWEERITRAFSPGGMTAQDHIKNTYTREETTAEQHLATAEEVNSVIHSDSTSYQASIEEKYGLEEMVMVAGSQNRTGTTTTAIQMANFLANQGKLVAYVEANDHNHLRTIISAYHMKKEEDKAGEWWQTKGVDYLLNDGVSANAYDYIIFDLGVLKEDVMKPFSQGDIKILCGSGKCFERDQLSVATGFCKKENIEDVNTLIAFLSKEEQLKNVYHTAKYVAYAPDLMGWHQNADLFKDVFKLNEGDRK